MLLFKKQVTSGLFKYTKCYKQGMQKLGWFGLPELEVVVLLILGYGLSSLKREASFPPSSAGGNQRYSTDADDATEQKMISETGWGFFLGIFWDFFWISRGFLCVFFWGSYLVQPSSSHSQK